MAAAAGVVQEAVVVGAAAAAQEPEPAFVEWAQHVAKPAGAVVVVLVQLHTAEAEHHTLPEVVLQVAAHRTAEGGMVAAGTCPRHIRAAEDRWGTPLDLGRMQREEQGKPHNQAVHRQLGSSQILEAGIQQAHESLAWDTENRNLGESRMLRRHSIENIARSK